MTITITQATAAYSDAGFWTKARDFTLRAGYEVIEKALWLFYAQQKPEMPLEVKAVISPRRRPGDRGLLHRRRGQGQGWRQAARLVRECGAGTGQGLTAPASD